MSESMLALHSNVFTAEEMNMAQLLCENGQAHLFTDWPAPGQEDEGKKKLLQQAILLNQQYAGGLAKYIENARVLLQKSLVGENPYDGWAPSVPSGERLEFASPEFCELEQVGVDNMEYSGWVIVAGGLGERLGYNGIKVSLPTEIVTNTCFLQFYIQFILAHEDRAKKRTGNNDLTIPFAIMTSGDTHDRTVALLTENNYFGMKADQITLIKQEKVPSLEDNDAKFSLSSKYELATKPHGHGDVHSLMHSLGVARRWADAGVRWIVFFQDTNAPAMRALISTLGVSVRQNFAMNSLTYPRGPGEQAGGIMRLENESLGKIMTINVEYNQLGPLLMTVNGQGDVADESGKSPYPGNVNAFIIRSDRYVEVLTESNGAIPEFVNPKYADETKTVFKKPTRLECMMQEYPKLLRDSDPVGITQLPDWLSHRPVKNNIIDAVKKYQTSGDAMSAASGEHALYFLNRSLMRASGVNIEEDLEEVYESVPCPSGAKIIVHPSFGTSLNEIRSRIKGDVYVSNQSTLVLDGDIEIQNLRLNGALMVSATNGSKIVLSNVTVENGGVGFTRVNQNDDVEEKYRIRGYVLDEREFHRVTCDDGTTMTYTYP